MKTIAFISQSGNVAKSTLATATTLEAVKSGLQAGLADLDHEHRSSIEWMTDREESGIEPLIKVYPVETAQESLECFEDERLGIIDAPSRATEGTLKVALGSDLVIQPTTPSKKDLNLAIKTFFQLYQAGVPLDKMVMVLTRVGTSAQFKKAYDYLQRVDFNGEKMRVLSSCIYEKPAYKEAVDTGLAITETPYPSLNDSAKSVIHQYLNFLI